MKKFFIKFFFLFFLFSLTTSISVFSMQRFSAEKKRLAEELRGLGDELSNLRDQEAFKKKLTEKIKMISGKLSEIYGVDCRELVKSLFVAAIIKKYSGEKQEKLLRKLNSVLNENFWT
jgi:hypothetical protein